MIFKRYIFVPLTVLVGLAFFIVVGVIGNDDRDKDELPDIPERVKLPLYVEDPDAKDKSNAEVDYKTYQSFDFSTLAGRYEAIDTPFVYVHQTDRMIVVLLSNDMSHPYVFRNQGSYWHCRWMSDERGDSIRIDRYIKNKDVYEYIQKRLSDGMVRQKLVKHDYRKKMELTDMYNETYIVDEYVHYLDPTTEFVDSLAVERYMADRQPKPFDEYKNMIRISRSKDDDITHQKYTYFTYSNGEKHYGFSPLLIYDDHKDCGRIPALKRIR